MHSNDHSDESILTLNPAQIQALATEFNLDGNDVGLVQEPDGERQDVRVLTSDLPACEPIDVIVDVDGELHVVPSNDAPENAKTLELKRRKETRATLRTLSDRALAVQRDNYGGSGWRAAEIRGEVRRRGIGSTPPYRLSSTPPKAGA